MGGDGSLNEGHDSGREGQVHKTALINRAVWGARDEPALNSRGRLQEDAVAQADGNRNGGL